MFPGRRAGVLGAACAVIVTGCTSGRPTPSTPSPVIARVASQTITLAQFNTRYHSALVSVEQGGGGGNNAAQTTALRTTVLRSLILDTVILEEATRLGLAATTKEIQAQVATDAASSGGMSALETDLAGAGGSIAQLEDEIRSDRNEQRLEDHFARARALTIEKMLTSGANFAATAKSYSDDTGSSAKGGDLGVLTAAELKTYDPNFAAAVESLKVGAYTTTPVHDAGGSDICRGDSKTAKGYGVRHILIYAGNPYDVRDRPSWFGVSLFAEVADLCKARQIQVTLSDAGGDPCSAASPSAIPATASPRLGASPSPHG
jgi:hypothetical protein